MSCLSLLSVVGDGQIHVVPAVVYHTVIMRLMIREVLAPVSVVWGIRSGMEMLKLPDWASSCSPSGVCKQV